MQYTLTADDQELLDVLAKLPDLSERAAGPVLHARFGKLTNVWQHVNALLRTEAALEYAPDLVGRLLRRRDRRGSRQVRVA